MKFEREEVEKPMCPIFNFRRIGEAISSDLYHLFSPLQKKINIHSFLPSHYSLVRLVWPNREELISRPFAGLYKIRLLLRDRMRPKNLRNFLALVQLQLCLQLQQNTIVPVDVDGQICYFCSQGFVP